MTFLDPQIRALNRPRHLPTNHQACCYRHPFQPVTGFCVLCLSDRLAATLPPELLRSKSVSAGITSDDACSESDLRRRKSCDVRPRNILSNLFSIEDGGENKCSGAADQQLESKKAENGGERIRVLEDELLGGGGDFPSEGEVDVKTMREYIDLEWKQSSKASGRVSFNFWEAASVFSQKLRTWRTKQKQKSKKKCGDHEAHRTSFVSHRLSNTNQSEVAEYGFGRRSYDIAARFSVDATVDDPRFSLDEARASWDGYLMARTIPRLTPMLPANVDGMMFGHPIIEEAGLSLACSNASDSPSLQRGVSSSDRSSSIKSTNTTSLGSEEADDVKSTSKNAAKASDVIFYGTKLVITEKELKDWHLKNSSTMKDPSDWNSTTAMPPPPPTTENLSKKANTSKWHRAFNLWGGYKGNGASETLDGSEKRVAGPGPGPNKGRSQEPVDTSGGRGGSGSSQRSKEALVVLERKRSARYSTSDPDSGLLRFYLTPFRNYNRSKSGRGRGKHPPPHPLPHKEWFTAGLT